MDFSSKQKDFCQRRTRFFGVKCPSALHVPFSQVKLAFPCRITGTGIHFSQSCAYTQQKKPVSQTPGPNRRVWNKGWVEEAFEDLKMAFHKRKEAAL